MGASAGRVLLISKGDWNSQATYTGLDMVRHNGATWVCKNTCTNVEPTENNTANWQLMARDGKEVGDMTGATATQNGAHGLVPAPQIGDEKKALLGNGTWGKVDAIFTYSTKDEYDTAVANNEIPDGATVIKAYDD